MAKINLREKVESIRPLELRRLGRSIRVNRTLRDLKQKELAKKIGVNSNYLSAIENGKRMPSLNLLLKITCVMNISLEGLFHL